MGNLQNTLPKWIFLFVWGGIQAGLFGYYFWFYYTNQRFYYTRKYLRVALAFARAPANCLNFNCMLILLPVCRNLLSFVRKFLCRCCARPLRQLLDQNIEFHKLSAYAICFWTAIHTVAHCYNAEFYTTAMRAEPGAAPASVSVYQLSSLGSTSCPRQGVYWVNPVCISDSQTVLEAIKIYPAISGVIITLALIIIVLSATEFIRRSYFEIFWITHHLFIVFFAFLVSHGFRGVVRAQDELSLEKHNPDICVNIPFSEWGEGKTCEYPTFQSSTPSTWCWVIVPMVLYVIERIIRGVRSFQKVVITKVSATRNLPVPPQCLLLSLSAHQCYPVLPRTHLLSPYSYAALYCPISVIVITIVNSEFRKVVCMTLF